MTNGGNWWLERVSIVDKDPQKLLGHAPKLTCKWTLRSQTPTTPPLRTSCTREATGVRIAMISNPAIARMLVGSQAAKSALSAST